MMRFLDIVQGSTLILGGQYVPPIKHTIIDTNTCEVAECLNTVDSANFAVYRFSRICDLGTFCEV